MNAFLWLKAQTQRTYIALILRITCFLIFGGRAFEHLFWNVPYREFFWSQKLMGDFVGSVLGMSWNQYMTSGVVDFNIQLLIKGIGVIFAIAAFCSLIYTQKNKVFAIGILLGVVFMLPLLWLHFFGDPYNTPLFFEFTAQFCSPLFLLYLIRYPQKNIPVVGVKIAIALTFIAHGLYAMNVFPLPQKFIRMMIVGFGTTNILAKDILFYLGMADLIVAVGIFFPKAIKWCAFYAFVWGFFTAFARLYTYVVPYDFWRSFSQSITGFLVRTPHYSLPLIIFLIVITLEKAAKRATALKFNEGA
jgi:hypothetical protein